MVRMGRLKHMGVLNLVSYFVFLGSANRLMATRRHVQWMYVPVEFRKRLETSELALLFKPHSLAPIGQRMMALLCGG